jgi:lipoate-protein ligase A
MVIESLQKALIEAFGEVYGGTPQAFPAGRLNREEVGTYEEKYASGEWRLGRRLPFTAEYNSRFAWGDLTLQFCVEGGVIQEAMAYSDGMETNFIKAIGSALKGVVFSSPEIKAKLLELAESEPLEAGMLTDMIHFVEENNF